MTQDQLICLIIMLISVAAGLASYSVLRSSMRKIATVEVASRKVKIKYNISTIAVILCSWLFMTRSLKLIFGGEENFGFSVIAGRIDLFGLNISSTVFITWLAMILIFVAAIVVRITIIPKLRDKPEGLQNLLEIAAGLKEGNRNKEAGSLGINFRAYLFALLVLVLFSLAAEIVGLRGIVFDIFLILSMAVTALILVIFYGIKDSVIRRRKRKIALKAVATKKKIVHSTIISKPKVKHRRSVFAALGHGIRNMKGKRTILVLILCGCAWVLISKLIGSMSDGQYSGTISFTALQIDFFGLDISSSVVVTWIAMLLVLILAVIIRIVVIPKMKEKPAGIQGLLEIAVDGISEKKKSKAGYRIGDSVSFILITILFLTIASALAELLGIRTTTIDITVLIAIAALAFTFNLFYKILTTARAIMLKKDAEVSRAEETQVPVVVAPKPHKVKEPKDPVKLRKRRRKFAIAGIVIVAWILSGKLITWIFGEAPVRELEVELFAGRIDFFGIDLSTTIVSTWIIIGIVLILALLARKFVISKMKDKPEGLQNLLEIAVGGISEYTEKNAAHLGDNLSAYMLTIVVFMISSMVVELFGAKGPTADITVTAAMGLMTFVLLNYYGIKQKGFLGRIKSLSSPTPVIMPMKMISDIAVPVSLACRLFGNMLGGVIVLDLLYFALGNNSFLVPSILGLFFNVAHPMIQVFVFVTLSLTFINEAAE